MQISFARSSSNARHKRRSNLLFEQSVRMHMQLQQHYPSRSPLQQTRLFHIVLTIYTDVFADVIRNILSYYRVFTLIHFSENNERGGSSIPSFEIIFILRRVKIKMTFNTIEITNFLFFFFFNGKIKT